MNKARQEIKAIELKQQANDEYRNLKAKTRNDKTKERIENETVLFQLQVFKKQLKS